MARNPKNLTRASLAQQIADRLDGMEAMFPGPIEDQDDDFEIDQTHTLMGDTVVLQGQCADGRRIQITMVVGDVSVEGRTTG